MDSRHNSFLSCAVVKIKLRKSYLMKIKWTQDPPSEWVLYGLIQLDCWQWYMADRSDYWLFMYRCENNSSDATMLEIKSRKSNRSKIFYTLELNQWMMSVYPIITNVGSDLYLSSAFSLIISAVLYSRCSCSLRQIIYGVVKWIFQSVFYGLIWLRVNWIRVPGSRTKQSTPNYIMAWLPMKLYGYHGEPWLYFLKSFSLPICFYLSIRLAWILSLFENVVWMNGAMPRPHLFFRLSQVQILPSTDTHSFRLWFVVPQVPWRSVKIWFIYKYSLKWVTLPSGTPFVHIRKLNLIWIK